MLEQDENLEAKIKMIHSEMIVGVSESKMLDAFIISVNHSLTSQAEGVVTAVVVKERYHTAIKNQITQRLECLVGVTPVRESHQ